MNKLKANEVIEVGRWIWEKDLTGGMSGNLSVKLDQDSVLITGRGACLGMLSPEDVCAIDMEGKPHDKNFTPSSEYPFHTSVYKNLDVRAVVHVHPTWSNGYFAARDTITFDTFETRLTFGEIPVVDQKTPTITDLSPVIDALKKSNIIILKHHGVVAIGETLKDAFFLVQTLEEAVQMAFIRDFYAAQKGAVSAKEEGAATGGAGRKYRLFSEEQIKDIVSLVNQDEKFAKLATETALKTKLAVVLDETQETFCFDFRDGKIAGVAKAAEGAEFVISGKMEFWKQIFNRQLDPFAATTQKKLKLKGDFAKISRWYVPFNRLFELWVKTPVE